MKRFTLAAVLLLALPSFADSFDQFALQGGRFPLSPDSNPLLTTSSPGNGPWDALLFFTIFNFNGPVTVTYKVDIGNLHFVNTDSFPCIDCAYSQTYLLSGFPTPTQGTLTVTVQRQDKGLPISIRCSSRTGDSPVTGDWAGKRCVPVAEPIICRPLKISSVRCKAGRRPGRGGAITSAFQL